MIHFKIFIILIFNCILPSFAEENLDIPNDVIIERAYKNNNGRFIIDLGKKKGSVSNIQTNNFLQKHRFLYGGSKTLYSLKHTFLSEKISDLDRYHFSFADPRIDPYSDRSQGDFYAKYDENQYEMAHDKIGFTIKCGVDNYESEYFPLEKDEISILEDDLHSNKIQVIKEFDEIYKPTISFRLKNGNYIYIDSPMYDFSSENPNYRFFLGQSGKMKEYRIKNTFKIQDDHESVVKTDIGTLTIPPNSIILPKGIPIAPTWESNSKNEKITIVNLNNFYLNSLNIPKLVNERSIFHTPCDHYLTQKRTKVQNKLSAPIQESTGEK